MTHTPISDFIWEILHFIRLKHVKPETDLRHKTNNVAL